MTKSISATVLEIPKPPPAEGWTKEALDVFNDMATGDPVSRYTPAPIVELDKDTFALRKHVKEAIAPLRDLDVGTRKLVLALLAEVADIALETEGPASTIHLVNRVSNQLCGHWTRDAVIDVINS